jgi:hypothetical protein
MKLSLTADIPLETAGLGTGFITWFDVRAYAHDAAPLARARVALVHVGEIADAGVELWAALRDAGLGALHDTYFAQGWYKDEYADGAGIDLLFVQTVEAAQEWRERNLDLAIVRRLGDTLASGCQLVSMPYHDPHEATRWARLGFSTSTAGRASGLLHMKLGRQNARVVATGGGAFEVLSTEPEPGLRRVAN